MFIYQQNKLRRIVKSIPKLRSSTRKTMAQGKMKATAKVPKSVKKKEKGKAFTTRSRAPIQSKKSKFAEAQKLKQIVTKTVNRSMEEEMRSRARDGQVNLSAAQLAVAKHHKDLKAKQETVAAAAPETK